MNISVEKSTLKGTVFAPPSKSYLHRYLIASFLSNSKTTINNFCNSTDILTTLSCLGILGLNYKIGNNRINILSSSFTKESVIINVNESGTTLRFLLPIVSALNIKCQFTLKESLLNRPSDELIKVLNENGANIVNNKVNCRLNSGTYKIKGDISSQFISGLLFALPLLNGDSEIIIENEVVSKPYINLTLKVLKEFKIEVNRTINGYYIKGNQKYVAPKSIKIEGDYSNATYPLIMGALGGSIKVLNLNKKSIQGDKKIVSVLKKCGVNIQSINGGYYVNGGTLKPIKVDAQNIIDIILPLSVLSCFIKGESVFKNVNRLKIKESDRLNAIITNLKLLGANVNYDGNNLKISCSKLVSNTFNGFNDHRCIMSLVTLLMFLENGGQLINACGVEKSYASFFEDVKLLGGNINVNF